MEIALRRMLDFPCFVQIVPDKIVAFEMAMLNFYDVIILPFTCDDPFTTSTFVEIISSIEDIQPSLIYMVKHDEVYDVEEKSKYIRMSAEFTLNIRELVQAIESAIQPPSVETVSPGDQEVVSQLQGCVAALTTASLSVAPTPKAPQDGDSPTAGRTGSSKRKRSSKRDSTDRASSSRRARLPRHEDYQQHHQYQYRQGHGAPSDAEQAAAHYQWQMQMYQHWQAQSQNLQHPQAAQYMYPGHGHHGMMMQPQHLENLYDAYHSRTTSEESIDGATDYLATTSSTSSEAGTEHDHDFDNMAGFDYGILLVDESVAFEAFD